MKRLLFPLLILGLVSCSSCEKKDTVSVPCDGGSCSTPVASAVPTVVPVSPDQVVSEENWSLAIPAEWTKMEPPTPIPEVKVFYGNMEKHNLIIFVKEAFAGTNTEYTLETLRGLKDGGGSLNAARQVDLNGNKYVFVDATRDTTRLWMWITAKNGFGYVLSCGGLATDTTQEDLCTKVANTLMIK